MFLLILNALCSNREVYRADLPPPTISSSQGKRELFEFAELQIAKVESDFSYRSWTMMQITDLSSLVDVYSIDL